MKLPLHHRTTIRTMATEMNMSKSILHQRFKEGFLWCYLKALRPHLAKQKQKNRVRFCLSMIVKDFTMHNHMFIDMYDYVHIDEKWFRELLTFAERGEFDTQL